jgi:hypothetical protein
MHFALFWLDTDGKTHHLPVDVVKDQSSIQFVYPQQEGARPGRAIFTELAGPPGTELIFLCARRGREIADAEVLELKDLLGSGTPWPELPAEQGWLLAPQGVKRLPGTRGPGALTEHAETAVRERAEKLRRQLAERFDLFQGIAFPHVE